MVDIVQGDGVQGDGIVTYVFAIEGNTGLTLDLSFFGTDLVVTEDGGFASGIATGYALAVNWSSEAEAAGAVDRDVVIATLDPFDVSTIGATEADVTLAYVATVIGYAQALQAVGGTFDDFGGFFIETSGAPTLRTTHDNDYLSFVGTGTDVRLGAGNDVAIANEGSSAVTLRMGAGDDRANGSATGDLLMGGRGDDVLNGFDGADTVRGGSGADQLFGGAGDDSLSGDAGDDVIVGGAGADVMSGGAGNDVLRADAGEDRLTGGAGVDAFAFVLAPTDPREADAGRDVILDFQLGEDVLWIGPSDNATYDAALAFALFGAHAEQRGAHVVVRDGEFRMVIRNVDLDDFSAADFVDGPSGGIFGWADQLA
ncbi:MAG: calcium-binding protein [Pseudomonadota bacterium]